MIDRSINQSINQSISQSLNRNGEHRAGLTLNEGASLRCLCFVFTLSNDYC